MRGIRITRAELQTPRAAGVAGVLFAVLFGTAVVLIGISQPSDSSDAQSWLSDPANRGLVSLALNLVPFAGIAFLWFVGVIRDRVGQREDKLFATVFLGSGLLFVSMMFVASAVAAGLVSDPDFATGQSPPPGIWELSGRITFTLLNVYATRMGGVFILSTTGIGRRTKILPTWLVLVGVVAGLVLLVGSGMSLWVNLVLPAWALLLSTYILLNNAKVERRTEALTASPTVGALAGSAPSVGNEPEA